jgi:hypothetical protein
MTDMGWTTDWGNSSATAYTISSTTALEGQQYYSIGPNGEAMPIDMGHNHTLHHQHTHGSSVQWHEPNTIEEIVRFNGDVQIKANGKWVSMDKMMKRIDALEKIVGNLYSMLPSWKIDMMGIEEDEEIDDEVDHIDPDLFKV